MDLRHLATALAPAVVVGACSQPPPAATTEQALGRPAPAAKVEVLEDRQRLLDDDGDGYIDETEAEAYYQRRFSDLDDNNDGRLSRAELAVEYADVPEAEVAYEELVGASADVYSSYGMRRFNMRADRTTGMMSTADFDEMVRSPDPMVGTVGPAR